MNVRSVRARLTGLVLLVALAIGLVAATVGVRQIEADLIDDAVEAAADNQLFVVDEFIEFAAEIDGFDLDGLEFAEEFFVDDELDSLVAAVAELREAGVLGELRTAAGLGDDEPMTVLTNFGELVQIDPVGLAVDRSVDESQAVGSIVPQIVVDELAFIAFDVSLEDIFGAVFSGEPASQRDDLLFATVQRDGLEYVVFADVGDVRHSVDSIRAIVWLSVPVLTLGAAVVAWLLTGRALRPVHDITSQVREISGRTLHERVPEPGSADEIAELAATMNAMLDRLEVDDQRLRQFVSDASHELRSPVAVLRSEAEVAARNPEHTSVAELADGVLGEATRLQGIVEDLLVLARGDERQAGADVEVDVDDVVLAEAQRRRQLPVDTRGVSAGRVLGSVDAVTRVVTHLLDNAARHGTTQVKVALAADDHAVVLVVEDDGAGIAPADRVRVFERFTRLDDARTRDRGGAGLGLAVVAETVRAMRGSVVVEDSDLGGARLVVRWPTVSARH